MVRTGGGKEMQEGKNCLIEVFIKNFFFRLDQHKTEIINGSPSLLTINWFARRRELKRVV